MLYGLFIFIILATMVPTFADNLGKRYKSVDPGFLKQLFFYHYLLWIAYYSYAQFNRSDSISYFLKVSVGEGNWFDYYGISTRFVEFATYPFVNFLSFTYEAMMILFAFLGYLGFVYLYIFFKETIKFNHSFLGFDLITFLFFLPNTHFWTVSLGKGSMVFFGIGLFFYGISKINTRTVAIIFAAIIIYHVRPHILFVLIIAVMIGFGSSAGRFSFFQKALIVTIAALIFANIYQDILDFTGLEDETLEESAALSHRARELTKATSGVDIESYSIWMKLFTFWFRPLFVDAPGLLGLIVSIENFIYLILIVSLVGWNFLGFLVRSDPLVRTSLVAFLLVSYPLAQISGNLGLALRQKSMVMMLLFFVLVVYQDRIKLRDYKNFLRMKFRKQKKEEYLKSQKS